MDKLRINTIMKQYDAVVHKEEEVNIEFWYARELMHLLGYERWENFEKAISRAMSSCETSGIEILDHFREVTKMVTLGSGSKRNIKDYMLTRYACYLIAQNGNPKKEEIAFAQSYFAIQTRKQELIEERIAYIERTEARGRLRESEKRLSQNIYERGVDDAGFGRIRSKGDTALFGGRSTQDMKKKLGVKDNRPLADFLPTLTIAAKNLATEMTNYNVEEKGLLKRTHGGALPIRQIATGRPAKMTVKDISNVRENYLEIAKKAVSMIRNNDVIYIPSATVGLFMVQNLPENLKIRVVTNSIVLAEELRKKDNISVIMLGGEMDDTGN